MLKLKKIILGFAAFMIVTGLGCASAFAEEGQAVSSDNSASVSASVSAGAVATSGDSGSAGGTASSDSSATSSDSGASVSSGSGNNSSESSNSEGKSDVAPEKGNASSSAVESVGHGSLGESAIENSNSGSDPVISSDVSDDSAAESVDDSVENDAVTSKPEDETTEPDKSVESDKIENTEDTENAENTENTDTDVADDSDTADDKEAVSGETPDENTAEDNAVIDGEQETDKENQEEAETETDLNVTETVNNEQAEQTDNDSEAEKAEEPEKAEEKNFVARVADNQFETVEEAIAAAEESAETKVYLINDAQITDTIEIDSDIEIVAEEDSEIRLSGNGTLFSINSAGLTISNGISIYSANTSSSNPLFELMQNAVLNINGGYINSDVVNNAVSGGKVTVSGNSVVNGDITIGVYGENSVSELDLNDYSGETLTVVVDPEGTYDGSTVVVRGASSDDIAVSSDGYVLTESEGGLAVSEQVVDPYVTVELVYDSELDDPGVYDDVATGWYMTITAGTKVIETVDAYINDVSVSGGEPVRLDTKIAQGSQVVIGVVAPLASKDVHSFDALINDDMYDTVRIGRGADTAEDTVEDTTEAVAEEIAEDNSDSESTDNETEVLNGEEV